MITYTRAKELFEDKANNQICIAVLEGSKQVVKKFIRKNYQIELSFSGLTDVSHVKGFQFFDNAREASAFLIS